MKEFLEDFESFSICILDENFRRIFKTTIVRILPRKVHDGRIPGFFFVRIVA